MSRNAMLWLLWIMITVPVGLYVIAVVVYGGNRSFLLVGRTTNGHHQIELACDACHSSVFGGADVLQDACMNCHGAELKDANDTHPKSKFTDPRNADRTEILDATYCVTCHREHRPGITNAMGVTLPTDYCVLCHRDIGEERPSHEGLAFTTCASAGCHRFHDNRPLYSDFLIKHAAQSDHLDRQVAAVVEWLRDKEAPAKPVRPLTAADADAPARHRTDAAVAAWAGDRHAEAGVNCSGCHTTAADRAAWIEAPGLAQCQSCHAQQVTTFTEGKHGMRQRPGLLVSQDGPFGLFRKTALPPMTPAQARIPMKKDAHDVALGCNTCHSAHKYDRAAARTEACTGCHNDPHTAAYFQSPHYDLLTKEMAGALPRGSGVSCATCHMPATTRRADDGSKSIFVTHNQNDNLRPNEKMVRSVCGHCHGLQFSLDALADTALIAKNFKGRPTVHIESIEWALRRAKERARTRR
jgi:cytochrome c3-like protein